MSAHIQVSREERAILTLFGLGVIGLIVVLALLNGVFTYIGWAPLNPDEAEIAVLVADKQETPGKEIIEVANLGANRASSELQAAGKTLMIRIHVYETGENPNSAAWAAKIALRNPNTVAVIGPFDTRQSIAVAETLHDQNLAMLTPDGLSPIVSRNNPALDSVYRLSLPYTEQASHMPAFLHNQGWNNVYLIAEPTEYAQKVLEEFNPAANNTIKVIGTANITDTPAQEIVAEVKNLKPHALFYIGGPEQAVTLLDEMNKEWLQIPLVGLDPLSEPSFLSNYVGNAPVYYASSLFNLQAAPEDEVVDLFKETLAGKTSYPYAYETLEAVWFVYNALNNNQSGDTLRERVWYGINRSTSFEWNGGTTRFSNQWKAPSLLFIYELTMDHSEPKLFTTMER